MEADVADARRSTAKLRRRLAEMRARTQVMHGRTMTLLGHSQTATSPLFSASPGADCSDHESTDHAAADHQQVSTSAPARSGSVQLDRAPGSPRRLTPTGRVATRDPGCKFRPKVQPGSFLHSHISINQSINLFTDRIS